MVNYIPIEAKTILNRYKFMDDWFLTKCGFNLYRSCEHACAYCDGRHEKYSVDGVFGEDIFVKTNAVELLREELSKVKERTLITVGGGVGDSYQPAEEKYQLARGALKVIAEVNFPCFILTKSSLVKRDMDLVSEINKDSLAIVAFSISSLDPKVYETFEPRAASPMERLKTLEYFAKTGIPTGVMLVPIIPYLSDDESSIEEMVKACRDTGAKFILFGSMTLKKGRQKDHFMSVLTESFPGLVSKYEPIYEDSKWGNPHPAYSTVLNYKAYTICQKYEMPTRIPYEIFRGKIDLKYEVAALLSYTAHSLEMSDRKGSAYRRASLNIQKTRLNIKLLAQENRLREIPGVGPRLSKVIREIVLNRKCNTQSSVAFIKTKLLR